MNIKIILLTIYCANAAHITTDLLPPANVANVFHESGITFVSPSVRNLEISRDLLAPPLPVTHTFAFVEVSPNRPLEFVRTHSSQELTQSIHSSISAVHSPHGIQSNFNGQIKVHRDDSPSTPHLHEQALPTGAVHARFVEHENHGMHEIGSRTQHFEYKVPLIQTAPIQHEHVQHIQNHHHHEDIQETKHPKFTQRNSVAKHSTYGVPTFIPSQDEINALPVFHNDKFLSPSIARQRHTNTPTHSSNHPVTQTVESIVDPHFNSNNNPIARTRANVFDPSNKQPTTHTREQVIDGNNQYKNRFSLSDGTKVSEEGKLISTPECENVIAKSGEYEYISPDGTPVKVKWIADHGGFRVIK